MNQREGIENRRAIVAAIALILPLLLMGCSDNRPYVDDNDIPPVAGSAWPQATYYTVVARPGDTLPKIAARYDVAAAEIARLNEIDAKNRLHAGQVLRIPAHSDDTRAAVMDEAASRPARF